MTAIEIFNPELYFFAAIFTGLLWFKEEKTAMVTFLLYVSGWFLVDLIVMLSR